MRKIVRSGSFIDFFHHNIVSNNKKRKVKESLQQCQRDITLQPSLQLNLHVKVKPKLKPHRLGVSQTGQHSRVGQAASLGELLVVSAAATAARVDRRGVRRGVVELMISHVNTSFASGVEQKQEREQKDLPGGVSQQVASLVCYCLMMIMAVVVVVVVHQHQISPQLPYPYHTWDERGAEGGDWLGWGMGKGQQRKEREEQPWA